MNSRLLRIDRARVFEWRGGEWSPVDFRTDTELWAAMPLGITYPDGLYEIYYKPALRIATVPGIISHSGGE